MLMTQWSIPEAVTRYDKIPEAAILSYTSSNNVSNRVHPVSNNIDIISKVVNSSRDYILIIFVSLELTKSPAHSRPLITQVLKNALFIFQLFVNFKSVAYYRDLQTIIPQYLYMSEVAMGSSRICHALVMAG